MSEETGVGKIAAEFLQHNIATVIAKLSSGAKDVRSSIRARLERTYRDYINRLLERHARGKSFFIRSEPVPLYDFFVPLDLTTQIRILHRPDARELATTSPHSIITGTGGSGKSMMMRHLLVSALKTGEKIPVFIELRQLNQAPESLEAAILRAFQSSGLDVDGVFLNAALDSGQLFVMMDGFDEVAHAERAKLANEVRRLAQRNPKNWVVMSSRPDPALEGWDEFTIFNVAPLDLHSAVDLVVKLPFESPVKTRFIEDMKAHLFEKHQSFLSNPLLLSIMLLTYSDVAHIPHKLSTFYSQAFESLFHRHDALKGGFQRDRKSGLDIQDTARAFSAFSLLSYDRRDFSFPPAKALEYISAAKGISMLSFDSQAFLDDAVQAICLLLEDGMEIAFAHRSFQEYFVARYLHSSPPEVKAKLIQRFIPSIQSDAVLALLHEIDPYIVERHYILPFLEELRTSLGVVKKVGITHYHRYLRRSYKSFRVDDEELGPIAAVVADIPLHVGVSFTYRRYRDYNLIVPYGNSDTLMAADLLRAEIERIGSHGEVRVTQLTTRNQFVQALARSRGVWGMGYLQTVLDIEDEIRDRHSANKEGLEHLLTEPPSRKVRARSDPQ